MKTPHNEEYKCYLPQDQGRALEMTAICITAMVGITAYGWKDGKVGKFFPTTLIPAPLVVVVQYDLALKKERKAMKLKKLESQLNVCWIQYSKLVQIINHSAVSN